MRAAAHKKIAFLAIAAVALAYAPVAEAGNHVRVVLDLSKSMRKQDPGRVAVISTRLLFDLVNPNLSARDDSFAIIPFHLTLDWKDKSKPEYQIGPRIEATSRAQLYSALDKVKYDAQMTYFFPGLAAATAELEKTPGGNNDRRVVVLITDGLPDFPGEYQFFASEVEPRMKKANISLYVLAFAAAADPQGEALFKSMTKQTGLGDYFSDPSGQNLPENMAKIFSKSFGYTFDTDRRPGPWDADLAGPGVPERVAVILFSRPSGAITAGSPKHPAPKLSATHPAGAKELHVPAGNQSASEAAASYVLAWVNTPSAGNYHIDRSGDAHLAILRPTSVLLEVRSKLGPSIEPAAMAEVPLDLDILVKPAGGAAGDPGQTLIESYEEGAADCEGKPCWQNSDQPDSPPATDRGTVIPEGRRYGISALWKWPENIPPGEDKYLGGISASARAGRATIGRTHKKLWVYRPLSIRPTPADGYAIKRSALGSSPNALSRGDVGCTTFKLLIEKGPLPHPARPEYGLRAELDASVELRDELHEAFFTLDGRPLDIRGKQGTKPGEWYTGVRLSGDDFTKDHKLCVHLGRPTAGDPAKPREVELQMVLLEPGYNQFNVIKPFKFKVLVVPPTLLDKYGSLFILLALLLGLFALLWYLRSKPVLAPDLCYALSTGNGELKAMTFGPGSTLRALAGLVVERPIVNDAGDRVLAWVRPINEELFDLRLPQGAHLRDGDPSEIEARKEYTLSSGGTAYRFRLEYR